LAVLVGAILVEAVTATFAGAFLAAVWVVLGVWALGVVAFLIGDDALLAA
jgi:hypothetical protein